MNLDISYYFSVFLRRIYVLVIIAMGVAAASVYVAFELPPTYRAQARLLVESPQIPDDMAASTVRTGASEQLQIIEQRLLTRDNLLEIARQYNVFPDANRMTADEIVSEMRGATRISQTNSRSAATVMSIQFTSARAQTAAAVANDYVTRILEENRIFRTQLAEQTLDFFDQEVDRLESELARQSARIVSFKQANADSLPEGQNFRQQRRDSLQERLVQVERDTALLEDQKKRLIDVYEGGGQLADGQQLSPEAQRLAQLQTDLDNALALYSPTNPRIRILEAQIKQAEEKVTRSSLISEEEPETSADPRRAILDLQLAEIEARQDNLAEQSAFIEGELEKLADAIGRTPEIAIAIDSLERDYANIQGQYNQAVQRLATAATGERIELLSKGERIVVLEQATVPSKPSSPNRPLIAGGGAIFGIGLGAGAILLLELLNQSIRRPVDLERQLGVTPIATLPYIRTRRETIFKRTVILLMIAVVIVGGPAILYAVHTYFMPIDLLLESVIERILG